MFANWLNLGKEGPTAKVKSRIWYFIGDTLVKTINNKYKNPSFGMNLVCRVLIWENFGINVVKKFKISSLIKFSTAPNSVGKIWGKLLLKFLVTRI